jgi:hypothetical protein
VVWLRGLAWAACAGGGLDGIGHLGLAFATVFIVRVPEEIICKPPAVGQKLAIRSQEIRGLPWPKIRRWAVRRWRWSRWSPVAFYGSEAGAGAGVGDTGLAIAIAAR